MPDGLHRETLAKLQYAIDLGGDGGREAGIEGIFESVNGVCFQVSDNGIVAAEQGVVDPVFFYGPEVHPVVDVDGVGPGEIL